METAPTTDRFPIPDSLPKDQRPMEPARLLHGMCHDALTNVDINAIRKSRGFSAAETASRSLLENFYLTEIGVQAAMNSLTSDEISALHLLKMQDEAVQVSFFERLYQDRKVNTSSYRYHRTFSQRFQEIFKKVRTSLVRRGILIMAEAGSRETKMERWHFLLPKEFVPFLPPLFPEAKTFKQAGTVNSDVVRKALLDSNTDANAKDALRLSRGSLLIGKHEFTAHRLHEWLQAKWKTTLKLPDSTSVYSSSVSAKYTSPVDALYYMLAQLGPDKWITPKQIGPVLYIFSGDKGLHDIGDHPRAEEVCEAGWQWGQLARQKDGGNTYYRLAPSSTIGVTLDEEPTQYLKIRDDGSVRISLRNITNDHLELIARASDMEMVDEQLVAKPNLVKLGKMPIDMRNRLLIQWLGEHAFAYKEALSTVEKQWGKQILHTNLMLAKVNDLSLKVAIEKAFAKSDEIQLLPNDYIVFPLEALPKVERVVKKAGHVVKTVSAEK